MNTCSTCKWWRESYRHETKKSTFKGCDCPKLKQGYGNTSEDCASDEAIIEDDEGWGIQTGPDFGCIHHEAK